MEWAHYVICIKIYRIFYKKIDLKNIKYEL